MSPAKQVPFELAEELRNVGCGEEKYHHNYPVETFFGNSLDSSNSERNQSEDEESLTVEKTYNHDIEEEDF